MNAEAACDVSIIVASVREADTVRMTLESIYRAIDAYRGQAELLLVRDAVEGAESCPVPVRPGTTVLDTGGGRGSAVTRYLGIRAARGDILLFTDDDVLVPERWVQDLADGAARHGTSTGSILRRYDGFWALCDERIDRYRVAARDSGGRPKFLSFPNLGIRRDLLPDPPFELSACNKADDSELASLLRLAGVVLHVDSEIAVRAIYPSDYRAFLLRKVRHGMGLGRLRSRLGRQAWGELELGSLPTLVYRWVRLSEEITSGGSRTQRTLGLAANLAYCAALATATAWYSLLLPSRRGGGLPRSCGRP